MLPKNSQLIFKNIVSRGLCLNDENSTFLHETKTQCHIKQKNSKRLFFSNSLQSNLIQNNLSKKIQLVRNLILCLRVTLKNASERYFID